MNRESVSGMIRIARIILWRSLQALLIFPSVMVGSLVLSLALSGESPVRATLEALYEYADESIRPAPSGFVLQRRCNEPRQFPDRKPLTSICESQETHLEPVTEVISHIAEMLFRIYLILVVTSAAFIAATFPQPFPRSQRAGRLPPDTKDHKP